MQLLARVLKVASTRLKNFVGADDSEDMWVINGVALLVEIGG
jgi:hypothetical protein